ncbi:uncharacterized protein LOC130851059 isoform X1 [Hippopotamus amphibius kiboko]|uniref:uncharacterized protein LOC130851059 isoform X1 n=1 Tax=Hippopotamus amphibius kiboko TaxID=575201 RepID=UPI002597D298|nr:uncharacterized protein LOC130851059 isoform X1 [Hippopotamus amphibius kiboko]XP_057586848.1 uncharacterized protein LOC130851059 isoform X1 [Hippopotamus amphibius kiboko]XP_057586849.1 uncharacterized protein LOC130851059 isoform X1 [Hippopotamus amphibius kiboko]
MPGGPGRARRRPAQQKTRVWVSTRPGACSSSLTLAGCPPGPTARERVRAGDLGSWLVTTSSWVFLHIPPHTTSPVRCRPHHSPQRTSQVRAQGGPSGRPQPLASAAGQGAPASWPSGRCLLPLLRRNQMSAAHTDCPGPWGLRKSSVLQVSIWAGTPRLKDPGWGPALKSQGLLDGTSLGALSPSPACTLSLPTGHLCSPRPASGITSPAPHLLHPSAGLGASPLAPPPGPQGEDVGNTQDPLCFVVFFSKNSMPGSCWACLGHLQEVLPDHAAQGQSSQSGPWHLALHTWQGHCWGGRGPRKQASWVPPNSAWGSCVTTGTLKAPAEASLSRPRPTWRPRPHTRHSAHPRTCPSGPAAAG